MKYFKKSFGDLIREMSWLKKTVMSQRSKIFRLEEQEESNIHGMEVEHDSKLQDEERRRGAMNDGNLQRDLEKQYGTTGWAKKFILEILTKRSKNRKQEVSVKGTET